MNIGAIICFYICFNYTQPEGSNPSQRYRTISLPGTRCICGLSIHRVAQKSLVTAFVCLNAEFQVTLQNSVHV